MAEPERRRRRPAVSCTLCRRRKIKCNREFPCSNCVRSKNASCNYATLSPPPRCSPSSASQTADLPWRPESNGSEPSDFTKVPSSVLSENNPLSQPSMPSSTTSSKSPSTPASLESTREVESLRRQIKQLKDQLSRATRRSIASHPATPNVDSQTVTTSSRLAGTFHMSHETPSDGHSQPISRFMMHKTRLFGPSHWMSGVAQFGDILTMIDPVVNDETSQVILDMQKCKHLGKIIKERRRPPWPTPITSDLPPKGMADALVDIYLRTIETVHRIFHVPTFKRDYELVWTSEASPEAAFLIQLKLILAIGATMYDDRFTLQHSAIRWIYEAQTWMSEPELKSRLNIQFLQTQILLLLAREIVGVEGSFIWVSAGELIRTAMYMGLHRDPEHLPKGTMFAAEIRRRIWNTILEIALHSSVMSGGPPLLSVDDFDTHPPQNFDDEQIMLENPTAKAEQTFTPMSVPLALRKMFPVRLAIAKRLNGLSDHSGYAETLRLDAELRASYKNACKALKPYSRAGAVKLSRFQTRLLDITLRRYLVALHAPYFGASHHETAYAFSRKVVVESSLKVWNCVFQDSPMAKPDECEGRSTQEQNDFWRMALCGKSGLRSCAGQACFLIAADLRAQVEEEEGLGPVTLRHDLLSVITDYKTWSLEALRAGETNAKGYMFLVMVSTLLDGLMRRTPKEQLTQMLVASAEEALASCMEIFEGVLNEGSGETTITVEDMTDLPSFSLPEILGDWGFLGQQSQFDFGVTEPMNWVYTGYP